MDSPPNACIMAMRRAAVAAPAIARELQMYFQLYKDKAGEWRWKLKAANHETVADSAEGYKAKASAKNAIESIQKNGPTAEIDDQTD